ncbi:RDD family protein [Nocardioides sp. LMS-CY]|uniref:RDD family protein n=1 Tax=Nocardioides sp. (strain LMS-CY) TaxID=2840457 RepID=UPI001C00201F|nr:RDD family protein [Nocardioides sp. LMS-CY]QWF21556.1 RDD family protein [Nocardioides sp. LMS-CY]
MTGSPAADLDRRLYAFAVDRGLAWAVAAAAAVLLVRALGPDRVRLAVVAALAVALLVGGVLAVVLGRTGSTPGNALAATRVVAEGSGTPIGVPAALLRQLVLGLAALPTLGFGVATLAATAATDPSGRRRGWHDRLVGSVVVDVRPEPPEPPRVEAGPEHVVNLTALRLVPVPVGPPAPRRAAPEAEVPMPPRWRIGFDSGETVVVEGLVLVGRRPEPRAGEQVGRLVPLPSEDMSLSKTHAQLQVAADGALVVMDRGSTTGSILIRQGVPRGLPSGRAATLVDGDRVRFGDREMSVARDR